VLHAQSSQSPELNDTNNTYGGRGVAGESSGAATLDDKMGGKTNILKERKKGGGGN
jgi:hypothetical protein